MGAGQGHGYRDALPHAAGELVRIAVHPGLRGLHAHFSEHLDGHLPGLLLADALVQADDLHDLIAAGVDGVEGGHGLLKYHGYPVAAYAA